MDWPESLADSLDLLERAASAKDAEIHRLRAEIEMKAILINELRGLLRAQAERFHDYDRRLTALERCLPTNRPPSSSSGSGKDTCPR